MMFESMEEWRRLCCYDFFREGTCSFSLLRSVWRLFCGEFHVTEKFLRINIDFFVVGKCYNECFEGARQTHFLLKM